MFEVKKLKTILNEITFVLDDKYLCNCYLMDSDNYCLRIYDKAGLNELYSIWFDSDFGTVEGNEEQYTSDNIDEVINKAFDIIAIYIRSGYDKK